MSTAELITLIAKLSALTFVVASMLAMGLSLTAGEILAPLRNMRLVVVALVANFILVPALAYGLGQLFGLAQSLNGLILLGAAGGAPFLPKLVQGARQDIAFGVGLMVMLMVVTIVYLPLVLPLLLPGVSVKPGEIAKSLVVLMLIPLALGLLWRSHWADDAAQWQPVFAKLSSIAILVMLVVGVGLNVSNIISLIGTRGIAALLVLVLGAIAIGLVLGGTERNVLGLGTGLRNFSAAILVAAQNFSGSNTLSFVLVGAVIFLLVLIPASRLMGRRSAAGERAPLHTALDQSMGPSSTSAGAANA